MGGGNGRAVPLRGLRRSAGGQADDERALFADELSFVGSSLAGGRKFLHEISGCSSERPRSHALDRHARWYASGHSGGGRGRRRSSVDVGADQCPNRRLSHGTAPAKKCLESVGLQQHSLTATQPSRTIADL